MRYVYAAIVGAVALLCPGAVWASIAVDYYRPFVQFSAATPLGTRSLGAEPFDTFVFAATQFARNERGSVSSDSDAARSFVRIRSSESLVSALASLELMVPLNAEVTGAGHLAAPAVAEVASTQSSSELLCSVRATSLQLAAQFAGDMLAGMLGGGEATTSESNSGNALLTDSTAGVGNAYSGRYAQRRVSGGASRFDPGTVAVVPEPASLSLAAACAAVAATALMLLRNRARAGD